LFRRQYRTADDPKSGERREVKHGRVSTQPAALAFAGPSATGNG
jgi:hypothetical protein